MNTQTSVPGAVSTSLLLLIAEQVDVGMDVKTDRDGVTAVVARGLAAGQEEAIDAGKHVATVGHRQARS